MSAAARRRRRAGWAAAALFALLAAAAAALLYGSRPALDGEAALPGLQASVTVSRDALGIATLAAGNRLDLARAAGFVHAQEQFLGMDIHRRWAAGELAALLGAAALPQDRRVPSRWRGLRGRP